MEVKHGYKHTEVGVIPRDWEVKSLDSVIPRNVENGIVDGPFGSNLKTIHYRKSGIPIITSGYVTEGRFTADSYLYVDKAKFEEEKRSTVRPGDIVMAKIGARCGASAILPYSHQTGILSGNALKITVDESRHSTYYIWQHLWALYRSGKVDQLRTVGAQPAISMVNLKKYKLPIPPLPEQRAIAAALSDVDALIVKLDQLIAKKRDLKQAAMQQLLTGKTRLPGFSGEWETKQLGDLSDIDPEQLGSDTKQDYEFKYISLEDVDVGTLQGYTLQVFGSAPSRARRRLRCGDVLVSTVRPNLKSHLWFQELSEDWICSTGFAVVRCKDKVSHPGYIFAHLFANNFIKQIDTLISGSNYPSINSKEVQQLEVPVPSFEEQRAIAEVIMDMNTEISILEQRLTKTRALKHGMMQELLTGRIRLV